MPTAPYNPRRRDEEDDADVPMPDGVDEIEVDVGEPAAPAPRTVLQRPQAPDAFGPAGIPDGPNLQTRRAVTKAVTGQRMEPRDYRNIAQRQGIEAFTPATGQQGMDAPDLQVRSAAIKAQLGAPMSNREIDRLNTRQTLEAQQGNLPPERSVSTLLAGSRLDPRGTRAEQVAEARRKAAEDKQAARAAEIQARRQFNSDAMAKYKAEGARYYTDPASGRLKPVVDEKGRQLYYRSDWEPGEDPQGRPAKVMRDEFGQRQFKRPPVVMSPDAKDEYLYADMGDGESKPYITLDEAAASEDVSLKRTALSALARRNNALRRERVAPVKQAYDAANAEYEAAKGTLAAMEMEVSREQERIGQIDQAALKETEGGFLGIGAKPTAKAAQAQQAEAQGRARVQQIEGERARLEEAVGPRGTLTLARTIAQADLRLAAAEAARDAYVDQESQIMARLEFARKDPATDPAFQANRAALEAATKAVDGAKASRKRFEEVLRGTPPATEAKPAATQPQGPSTLGGIVNVAERAGRQSMAAMNVLGASNRARKRDEYLSQAEKLEQQAENVATLQPTWSPESHATWAQRARDTAVQLRERARAMDESMGGELKAATEQMQKASLLQAAEGYQQYSDAEKWGAVRAFLSNPIEVATNIAAEGALGSIPALIAGAAGAASGGVPGLAAGTAIGSFATEYAGSLLESFQQAGIDLSDPAALAAAFDDPEIMADAQKRGVARGIPVAVFDALSGGLAGRTVRGGVAQALKAGAREVGEQAALGAGGELTGQVSEQLAMTGEVSDISLGDIAAEAIGELIPGGAQVAMGAATRRGQQPAAALPPPEDTGRPSTDVPPPAPGPITAADAVSVQPTPDEANARLQAEAANDPELAALLAESEPVATAPMEAPASEPAPAAEVAPTAVEPVATPVADEATQVPEPAHAPEPATPVAAAEPAVVAAEATPTSSPEPPVATTEITPEAEGAGAPAQQPAPTQAEDYARYQAIQREWADLRKSGVEPNSDQIQKLWAENEEIKNRYGGMPPEAPKAARETITPAEDRPIGTNEAGEQLYERNDGSIYRMRMDRKDRPSGYPDFGGDLAKLEQFAPASEPAPAPPEPVKPEAAATAEPLPPAQMKRPALRAELAAAGVQSVSGVPLEDANAAQLMAAVGKLRRGQLDTPTGEKSVAARDRVIEKIKQQGEEAKAAKAEAEDLDGFDFNMKPIASAAAVRTLSHKIPADGQMISRRDYIRKMVADGATIKTGFGGLPGRSLMYGGTENFRTEESLTKTGLDYAEFLIAKRDNPTQASPLATDKILKRLQETKKRKTDEMQGKAFAATEGVYRAAEIAALDIAILAVRAGRPIEQAVRMAIARFKARYPSATPDELSQAEASIRGAINEPPPSPKPTAPKDGDKRTSKVGPSMRKAGAPIEDMEYDARAQDERMKEAQAIVTKDGPEKAEAAIENPDIAPDTRVAIGGTLVRDKMLDIANAKPEEVAALTRDMNRIVRKMRPELATKAGQAVAMWGGIYRDISVASGIEYLRNAQKKMDDALGGKDAQDAIDGATAALDKDMTAAEIEAEIERLKKKYTTKPARKVLTALQKQVERVQKLRKLGALQREDLADLVGKELKIPTPSPEQMKRIAEIADRIKNAPTHAERSKAELDLADQLAVYKGVAAMDVLSSMLTAGVLSGYTTQLASLQGTALNMLFNIGTVAATNPSRLKPIIEGLVRGVPLGIDQFKAIWKTGVGTRDLQDKTGGAGSPLSRVNFERDFGIPGAAGKAATLSARISERVFRFMRAVDASFYYPAREAYATLAATKLLEGEYKGAELAEKVRATLQVTPEAFLRARQQAASEGYTGVDLGRRVADIIEAKRQESPAGLQAVKESEQFAAESTFTNEPVGLAGVAYRAMRNLVENAKVAGVPILKPWLMFLKTPANVFNAVTNYTPAGFVRSQFGMMGTSPGKENRRNFTADERAQLNIKAAIGTTLMSTLLIGLMDDEDIEISGKGPQDAGKRRQMQDRGWIPYSVRMGDKYVSYKDSPLLLPLAIVGNARDSVKYQKPKSDLVLGNQYADAMLKSGTTIFDLSMLTGLGDLLSAMRNSDMKGVSRTLASVPANTLIPLNRLLQQIDQTFDEQSYEVNPLVGSLPFARRTGIPRTDVLGRPTTYAPTKRFVSSEREGALDTVLREKGLFVSEPSKETKVGNRVMTEDEYRKYRQISGQRIRVRLESIVPRLKVMTKEAADKEIDRIEREERERAKRAVVIGTAAPKR